MNVCSVPGCDRPHRCRGLCNACYLQQRRTGTTARRAWPETCAADGCDERVKARGYCTLHYNRLRRRGSATFVWVRPQRGTCSECDRPAMARGWCGRHYQQWYNTQDPIPRLRIRGRKCSVEGCGLPHVARGYCRTHYGDWRERQGLTRDRSYVRHLPALIAAADGICALCDYPVDLSPVAATALRPSIDHVIPGRDHRLENLRLSHQSCNAARGNRADVHHVPPPWVRNPSLTPTGQLELFA